MGEAVVGGAVGMYVGTYDGVAVVGIAVGTKVGMKVGIAVGTGVGVICSKISRSESLKTIFEKKANISVPDNLELLPAYERPKKESPETPFRV